MKKIFTVFGFLLAVLLVSSCSGSLPDENGSLTIVWGNSSRSRSFVQEDQLAEFSYSITLTGPGATIQQEFSDSSSTTSATFEVIPGIWTVTVKGYESYENESKALRVMGIEQVKVKAGTKGSQVINMYTATEAGSWSELMSVVSVNNNSFKEESRFREEIILIRNSSLIEAGDPINIIRPVILIAESDVTIVRPVENGYDDSPDPNSVPDYKDEYDFFPFFYVRDGGSLTLGKNGMAGTLTFDNRNEDSMAHIFLYGSDNDSKLELNNGITIKGALPSLPFPGAGIIVTGGSTFIMNGGTITGNIYGVFIGDPVDDGTLGGGTFIINGGTITSNGILQQDGFMMGAGVFVDKENGGKFFQYGGVISKNVPKDIIRGKEDQPDGGGGEPAKIISSQYRGNDVIWLGAIYTGNPPSIPTPQPVTLTENSISNSAGISISPVYSGDNHVLTLPNNGGNGMWAYLYEGDDDSTAKKIGIILYAVKQDGSRQFGFYLGSSVDITDLKNSYGITDIEIGDIDTTYSGYGITL